MNKAQGIKHFKGFLVPSGTRDLGLSSLILKKLMELNIPLMIAEDIPMIIVPTWKGGTKKSGQTFWEPSCTLSYVGYFKREVLCGVNLVVSDVATASTDATRYFSNVQKLYSLLLHHHPKDGQSRRNMSLLHSRLRFSRVSFSQKTCTHRPAYFNAQAQKY